MVGPMNPGGRSRLPGIDTTIFQQQNVFLKDPSHRMTRGITIDSATRDDLNTVSPGATTKLRAGLALVRIETGAKKGKYTTLGSADDPGIGSRVQGVLLLEQVNILGRDMVTPEDTDAIGLFHGQVDEAKVLFNGAGGGDVTDFKELMLLISFEEKP